MSDPIEIDSNSRQIAALVGRNNAGGDGLDGTSRGGTGVRGETRSDNGGVKAYGFLGGVDSIKGEFTGVYGESSNRGVFGHSDIGVGVFGHTNSGTAILGEGPGGSGLISGNDPVFGQPVGAFGQSGTRGVLGVASNEGTMGVHGISNQGTGVLGSTANGVGVEGRSSGDGLAGKFDGDIALSGVLSVTHPEGLHLNAGALRIHGSDILLDGRSAEISPDQNFRALVDLGNKLVINFQGDFGDGVSIESGVAVAGDLTLSGSMTVPSDEGLHLNAPALRIHGSDVLLDGRSAVAFPDQNFRALVDMTNKLVINFNGDFGLGVEVDSDLIVAGRVRSRGGDCAEQFDLASDATNEPGTVMVIGQDGTLEPCQAAYDTRVAGIISGAGDLEPALVLNEREGHRAPIALAGTAYCRVDANYGAVAAGDLLTTSMTPGHAMKSADRDRSFGAIIGKALRPLAEGTGLIPVLVSCR